MTTINLTVTAALERDLIIPIAELHGWAEPVAVSEDDLLADDDIFADALAYLKDTIGKIIGDIGKPVLLAQATSAIKEDLLIKTQNAQANIIAVEQVVNTLVADRIIVTNSET